MKKYTAILISAILLTSFTLSGCSGSNKEDTQNKSKTTIKFATFYSEKDKGSLYKAIADEFEKKNKDIKVEITYDYGDDSKIKESVSQKGDFDIIGLKRNQIIEFSKSGQLEDISDTVETNNYSKKLYKVSLSYGKNNGKNYGIGDAPDTIEWFYNTDMFEKYNLKEPKSLSQLADISKKLKVNNISPIGVGGMDGWNLAILLSMITAQTTGSSGLTTSYGSDAATYQNLKGIDDAFTTFGKLITSCVPANSIDMNYRQSIDDFVKGKSAILPTGSWAIQLIEQIKPNGFHYKVFELPVSFVDNPVTSFSATAGQILAIPSNGKNKKDALKFLEYIYSEDAQKIVVEKGYFSSLISANKGETTIKKLVNSHLEMTDDNSILIYDNLSTKMAENTSRILQDIVEGRVKSKEGWSRIVKLTFQQ